MTARTLVGAVLGLVIAAVVVIVATGGDDLDYKVKLQMDNAAGLREGRPVRIGGAEVGKVEDLTVGRGDVVIATLALDPAKARIGRGVAAYVKPTNLLADRYVDLSPGDPSQPEPSGVVIPSSRVQRSVDLDQVVEVLDPDTRTRLGIMINEAGQAFTGRRADFNKLLEELPPSFQVATELLDQVVSDNRTLGSLIERSQSFISHLTPERRSLSKMLGAAGDTMRTMSARRTQLRETINRAPGALSNLRRFLADLRVTTGPLAPAARAITATGPALTTTLSELEPFRQAAEPALKKATAVAPQLSRLGSKATPVLRRSSPVLGRVATFADELLPLSVMLDRGGTGGVAKRYAPGAIDDLLNVLHSWDRSIQERDGGSHIFRGYLDFNADVMRQLVSRYTQSATKKSKRRAKGSRPRPAGGTEQKSAPERKQPPRLDRVLDDVLKDAREKLKEVLQVPKNLPLPLQPQPQSGGGGDASELLDFLLRP